MSDGESNKETDKASEPEGGIVGEACWLDRNMGRTCIPQTTDSYICRAYDEKAFRSCLILDAITSFKKMADKVSQTSDQMVQQIEASWHLK